MKQKTKDLYERLGANERDLIDKISSHALKSIAVRLIRLKLKLQWKGWLQYLIPVPMLLVVWLIWLIVYLLGGGYLGMVFAIIGSLLLAKVLFDIITVKFLIRFPESRPKRQDDMHIFDLMRSRHSCRSYQKGKLSESDHKELMESVNKHLAEPKFSSEEIRLEYISTPIRVWPVVNATEFLVAIAPKEYNKLAVMDVGRTLQKVVIDATRMGLATCWIGPGADHKSIIPQLGERFNAETDHIICICAIGYPSRYTPLFIRIFSKRMRSRLPIDSLFFTTHAMDQSIDPTQAPYKAFQRTYEACQWGPSSYNGQTTRAVVLTNKEKFSRIDFFSTTTSRYYATVASGIWCANWEMGCEALGIDGEFRRLSEAELELTDVQKNAGVPVYNISWEERKGGPT